MSPRALLCTATLLGALLGLWLHWPSADAGFRGDDYVQGAMLRGTFPTPHDALDLFDFAPGDSAGNARLLDFGYLPWWTVPEVRLRMWRPLASALMATDHERFGWHARPMHLHSLAWFLVLLAAAALLLSVTLPPSAAAIGIVLFAIAPAHTVPVGWLANRSTLIATALGFLCVAAHVRSRARGGVRYALASLLFAVTALAAGEYALTALAYVLAYECVASEDSLATRARACLPVVLAMLTYLLLHSWLDADVVGSGFYLSPVRAPGDFLLALLTRIPVLVADLVLGLPSGYYSLGAPLRSWLLSLQLFSPATWTKLPSWSTLHVLIGYAALAAYAWLVRVALRLSKTRSEHRKLAFLALGALLALVPVAGSLPGDRLAVAATLGVSALVAFVLARVSPWDFRAAAGLSRGSRVRRALLALALFGMFVLYSGQRTQQQAAFFAAESESLRVWALDAELPERDAPQTRVYVIGSADFTTSANLPWLRLVHGKPLARSYRRLCPASAALDIRRVDDNTIDLFVLTSDAQGNAVPSLYRDRDRPLHTGDHVELPGMSVRVLRAVAGNPFTMRFAFDRPLDDASMWFLHSTPFGLRRVRMPALGERLRLPRPVMYNLRAAGLVPPGNFAE